MSNFALKPAVSASPNVTNLNEPLNADQNPIHFGVEVTSTPTGTTQTVDLATGPNHQTLDVGSASGALTLTFTPPAGTAAGTLIVTQDAAPKDISWAVTGGTIKWLGAEPVWANDTSKHRVVSWRWNGSLLFLQASGTADV